MKRICSVYKSPRKNEMYLYVDKREALSRVPEALLVPFGAPQHVFDLLLTPSANWPARMSLRSWRTSRSRASTCRCRRAKKSTSSISRKSCCA